MKTNEKTNWPLVGNVHVTSFLSKKISTQNASGTYIFSGPEDLGKTTVAYYFAKNLFCQQLKDFQACDTCSSCNSFNNFLNHQKEDIAHSDFHLIKREEGKKNISIEQIRKFIGSLEMTSFNNTYKIGIIKGAESLSREASNALLKTLEEPKINVVIILIASDLDVLPATIKSRSQILNFRPVSSSNIYDYLIKEHKATRSQAKNFSRLALGRPALAVKFLQNKDFFEEYRSQVQIFLNFFGQNINDRLQEIDNLPALVSKQKDSDKIIRTIGSWQGVIRDLLFNSLNQKELIQHEILLSDIDRLVASVSLANLIKINQELEKGKKYLHANVNPRLVLENIAINL